MAIAFNLIEKKEILNKKNIVLIIAVITTFSTSGYIVLFFVLSSYSLINVKLRRKIFLIPLLIIISLYGYYHMTHLEEKISYQYRTQIIDASTDRGRFGSARLDSEELKDHPLFGRGIIKATRFDDVVYWSGSVEAPRAMTNGLTRMILSYGLIGFAIYTYLLIKSLKYYCGIHNFNKQYSYFLMGNIFLSSFGSGFLTLPICISLLYFEDFPVKKELMQLLSKMK